MNMNEEDIPLLLKNARKLEKQFKKTQPDYKIKIAVLGSHSIQHFVMVLRCKLYQEGITADIYEGEYNGITMDVLDKNSPFYKFQPNVVILLTYYNDVKCIPRLLDTNDKVLLQVKKEIEYYSKLWKALSAIPSCHVLQTNFVVPPIRTLGNLEANCIYSESNFYRLLNLEFARVKPSNVTIVDMDTLASNIGKYHWFDYSAYFLNKAGFRLDDISAVTDLFGKQLKALVGRTKKCLVLDLDNTLWGGVVGDDGYDGIQLDPNNAVGEAYRFFQEYIKKLKKRGVILAVCSKNERDIAEEPFLKNENMVLKLEDIACFIANWEDKVTNIRRIAKELNIGIDSLVFFDDNPAEREIVKNYLPEVQVIDVPEDPADYALSLEKASPFEWLQVTKEDLSRSSSYYENKQRSELENNFENYDEYLAALEMKAEVGYISGEQVGRFAQLINKSNQFNLRTRRYTEAAIDRMRSDKNIRCLSIRLTDKFSDYGIISCVILRKAGEDCFIDTWVMSCRVLRRGVENLMFNAVLDAAADMGCSRVTGEYIRTKKNRMVENFYPSLGFQADRISNVKPDEQESAFYAYSPLLKPDKTIYINLSSETGEN